MHKRSMARLIFNDSQMFCSEIKKIAVRVVPIECELFPPSATITEAERVAAVKTKAAALLDSAMFLRGEPDVMGRTSNFAHRALKTICLAPYYSNTTKSLRQYLEFQAYVPYRSLVLVAAIVHSVLCTYKKYGHDKSVLLNAEEVHEAYNNLFNLISNVSHDKYHSQKLDNMLKGWVKIGMTGYAIKTAQEAEQKDWAVVLD
ncbi:hypothetical protein PAXINDRAFT_16626 [Paxillus involutus ATCC 200175]|uniref:DUF6532 domain-containing protein n=1 Tax=Paxillus involutus ATCC 200175 TaxID=664439 RepID=A0A0C9SRE8_PAXIN|nr:hypothetical protein PAXINDRAFT_16626 [Paxillus involutus ATCC 200175]